jgi:hypothetical protein
MRVYEPDEEELMVLLAGLRARQRSGIWTSAFCRSNVSTKYPIPVSSGQHFRWVFIAAFFARIFLPCGCLN